MSIKVLYNEIDPYCCAWLSNLMDAGLIRPGVILDKSIVDLLPDEVRDYDLVHYFAGLGGWDYALTLAGWRFDGRVTWTGSCPCQPFSNAGKQDGQDDARHLWPVFARLIGECRPVTVFGEQVAGAVGFGWLDGVCADMEAYGYAVGAAVLGAHSVGAPHIRQRLWWVADAGGERRKGQGQAASIGESRPWRESRAEDMRAITDSPFVAGRCIPQPLLRRMDDGFPAGVAALRPYGNAIVPQVAAEFISAFMECRP